LIETLLRTDKANSYTLYFNFLRGSLSSRAPRLKHLNTRTRVLRLPRKYADPLCDRFHFPIDLVTGSFDVLHGPAYELLYHRNGRSVVTIPDLTFHLYPKWLGATWRDHFIEDTYSAIERADLFITISEFIKGEMIEHLGIPGDRIIVTHLAVEKRFNTKRAEGERGILIDKYGLEDPYMLSVATREPKKNLFRLLKAYEILKNRISDPPLLALVGKRGWESPIELEEMKNSGLSKSVITLGYVPNEDLPLLYRHAENFLFPSLYEGFGMPLLEAMASGCPVIAGRAASIPEVSGDAAILVDPHDTEALARAMEEVATDTERRTELSGKGLERAREFTWEKTAKKTIEVYNCLL
jgi:glycosyltransferase involved in cell wall biosynthesis